MKRKPRKPVSEPRGSFSGPVAEVCFLKSIHCLGPLSQYPKLASGQVVANRAQTDCVHIKPCNLSMGEVQEILFVQVAVRNAGFAHEPWLSQPVHRFRDHAVLFKRRGMACGTREEKRLQRGSIRPILMEASYECRHMLDSMPCCESMAQRIRLGMGQWLAKGTTV